MSNNTTIDPPGGGGYAIVSFSPVLKIVLYTVYCFVFLLGTSGNMLVIYVIGIKHRVERTCDVHIVSLATADFLTAVFIPIVMIHDTLTGYMEWHLLGTFGCKVFVSMNHMTIIVSSLMLVTISLTRIHVIYSSVTIQRSMYRSIVEVITVWVLSIVITSPYMYHLRVVQDTVCFDMWDPEEKFLYFTIVQTISCFLSIVVMVVVYSLSAVRLIRHSVPGDDKVAERRRDKQMQGVTRMFGGIVFLFFALTTPYAICFFIVAYYGTYDLNVYFESEQLFFDMTQILYAVAALNCCVNPFIYAKMHRNMKRTFSKQISLAALLGRHNNNKKESRTIQRTTERVIFSTLTKKSTRHLVVSPSLSTATGSPSMTPLPTPLPSPLPSRVPTNLPTLVPTRSPSP